MCKDCINPNCPKCGTTHPIRECVKLREEAIQECEDELFRLKNEHIRLEILYEFSKIIK